MIKQYLLLLFALIFSGSIVAQEQVVSANDGFEQWENSLNTHLLNHTHPYVQAIGLSLSSPDLPLNHDIDERLKLNHEQQRYVDQINQLAKQDNLSAETIFLLISLCSNNALRNACDRQRLINQYQQQYPDDLNAYFEPLYKALNHKDTSGAEYLIKNMQNAAYMTDMTILNEDIKSVIKEYMDKNPVPRVVLEKQLKQITDVDKSRSNNELNQAFYYMYIAGIRMALPLPAYKPLLDYCSSDSSPTQACVAVANILITKGNNIISQLIGHRLKVDSYKNSLKTDQLIIAEEVNEQFRGYYDCILGALSTNNKYVDFHDISYAKLWFTNDNELQRIKSAAYYLFNKAQNAGFSDVKDPNVCDIESITP